MLRGFFGNLIFAIVARMLYGNHLNTGCFSFFSYCNIICFQSGPPEKVCIKIKLCKPVPAEEFASKLIMAAPEMEQKGEGLSHIRAAILESASNNLLPQDKSFCSVCQFMARLILNMLESKETEVSVR